MAGIEVSKEDYLKQLKDLLPEGPAWTTEQQSVLVSYLSALAKELKRTHDTANVLISESNPLFLSVTLQSRETEAGLPDACIGLADTTVERKNAVLSKWAGRGGQSRQFFIDLAASIGFAITITEFRPFEVGRSTVGDPLTNGPWVYTWQVNATDNSITSVFQIGISTVGDPLRSWGNELLECVINREKPARTIVIFAYS